MVDEVYGARFGDRRLTKRLYKIVEQLGAKPNMSIPAATDSRAELEAAYRFYNNSKVAPDAIYEPHSAATQHRVGHCPVVVLVQDTTELDLTRPNQQGVQSKITDTKTVYFAGSSCQGSRAFIFDAHVLGFPGPTVISLSSTKLR